MLRVTSQTHLLFMQTLITLQTIQNYIAIRTRIFFLLFAWVFSLWLAHLTSYLTSLQVLFVRSSRDSPVSFIQCSLRRKENWLVPLTSLSSRNSSTEPIGCCACATERITPRDDSFFPSHIKDLFWMNESFKNDPSLLNRSATGYYIWYLCGNIMSHSTVLTAPYRHMNW